MIPHIRRESALSVFLCKTVARRELDGKTADRDLLQPVWPGWVKILLRAITLTNRKIECFLILGIEYLPSVLIATLVIGCLAVMNGIWRTGAWVQCIIWARSTSRNGCGNRGAFLGSVTGRNSRAPAGRRSSAKDPSPEIAGTIAFET